MDMMEMTSPRTGAKLVHTDVSEKFSAWVAADGSGEAVGYSEAYEKLQEDELKRLWLAARESKVSELKCPSAFHHPMAHVRFDVDQDELVEDDVAPADNILELDICLECQMIWFDRGELDEMPGDVEDAKPTAEENAKLEEIRQQWSKDIDAIMRARNDVEEHDQMHEWLAEPMEDSIERYPQLTSFMHKVVVDTDVPNSFPEPD